MQVLYRFICIDIVFYRSDYSALFVRHIEFYLYLSTNSFSLVDISWSSLIKMWIENEVWTLALSQSKVFQREQNFPQNGSYCTESLFI